MFVRFVSVKGSVDKKTAVLDVNYQMAFIVKYLNRILDHKTGNQMEGDRRAM